jgi:hypothetical protein
MSPFDPRSTLEVVDVLQFSTQDMEKGAAQGLDIVPLPIVKVSLGPCVGTLRVLDGKTMGPLSQDHVSALIRTSRWLRPEVMNPEFHAIMLNLERSPKSVWGSVHARLRQMLRCLAAGRARSLHAHHVRL